MRLSTKGQYGLRAALDLADRYGEGPVPLNTVAEREEISEHYLEQIMGQLRKAGVVTSIRGAQGGYQLSRSPEEITAADVIDALDGPMVPVECLSDDGGCKRSSFCAAQNLWKRLADAMDSVLGSTTLADLVEENRQNRGNEGFMYFI